MDFQSLLNSAKATASGAIQSASQLVETATESFGSGLGYAQKSIANLKLFGSNEVVESDFDTKHYFLIPFKPEKYGYSLYSMRCLPDGVPPVNDLPKRRIFHLPNEHAARMVEVLLCDEAAKSVGTSPKMSPTANKLTDLADTIDQLDQKAFHGALLIGGLVALANPVAGGILAAKAMVPSIGFVLAKYGLKQASDVLDDRSLQSRIKAAERKVLDEFRGRTTSQTVDPLLAQLDKALNSEESDYDPLLDGDPDYVPDQLTAKAITNTYQETLANSRQSKAAGLGPEDIRWLKMLVAFAH